MKVRLKVAKGRGGKAYAGEIVSTIEPIFELDEVSGHMFRADRTIGSGDRGF